MTQPRVIDCGDTPKVTTVYVVANSYKNYEKFVNMQTDDPLQYRYLYDHTHLEQAFKNKLPVTDIKVVFLPYWFRHPNYLQIVEVAHKYDKEVLVPLYSTNLTK